MRRSMGRRVFETGNIIFIIALCILMVYPFLFVLAASLSSGTVVAQGMVGIIPRGLNFRAYAEVLKFGNIWVGYRNTLMYTAAGTALNLALTIAGAYPLSRKKFRARRVFTIFIPTYLVMRSYHLLNTFWVMILPGAISTWNLVIMRTFFQSIPGELEESGIIDGCNDIQVLLKIILPLSLPSVMTIGMFYAVGHWNAWFNAFIYLHDHSKFPVQLWLRMIVLQNQVNDIVSTNVVLDANQENLVSETIKYAVIIVAALPILCIYPFIQKFFVKGVMVGSIKG